MFTMLPEMDPTRPHWFPNEVDQLGKDENILPYHTISC